jgi:hypothetical protein
MRINAHFHAQTGTYPASLPSWPCRFDPGHPLHRKTLTQQGFSRAHGLRVLLKRRSCVPSGPVCTTPEPLPRPGSLRQAGHARSIPCPPAPPKTLAQQGFSGAHCLGVLPSVDHVSLAGPYKPRPLREAPARQASHARSRGSPDRSTSLGTVFGGGHRVCHYARSQH